MTNLKANEYKCAMCGGIFNKGWTGEEAMEECVENFGEEIAYGEKLEIICDDCYQKIRPDEHPEELAKAKEKFDRAKT